MSTAAAAVDATITWISGPVLRAHTRRPFQVNESVRVGEQRLLGLERIPRHECVDEAQQVAQLRRLRIHTRLPVVLPARVTAHLCELLATSRLQVVVVIHANHANEITPDLDAALAPLRAAGIPLLNQSVLLKSINDDADTLAELSEALFAVGVLPYYLHLLDPVIGAAHFNVLMYPETGEAACRWMERELDQPYTKTVPIGVGATREYAASGTART